MTTITTGIVDGPLRQEHLLPSDLIAPAHGAVTSFVGVVRNEHHGRSVSHLLYDCYRPMAETLLQAMAETAARQPEDQCRIACWHGIGEMAIGEASVAIHVASGHRAAGFAACRQLIEAIKADLPVWKHEFYCDGSSLWLKGS